MPSGPTVQGQIGRPAVRRVAVPILNAEQVLVHLADVGERPVVVHQDRSPLSDAPVPPAQKPQYMNVVMSGWPKTIRMGSFIMLFGAMPDR